MSFSCGKSGFQIEVNGYCISIQFGTMNYCDNQNFGAALFETKANRPNNCANAEVAVWELQEDGVGPFVRLGHTDDVLGYLTSDKVGSLIGFIAEKSRTKQEITDWSLRNLCA